MLNLTLLTDFYQLTMMNGYYQNNIHQDQVVFDMFFRKNPFDSSYTIIAGVEQVIDYIENLHFSQEDIDFLRKTGSFDENFLEMLKDFKFQGDIDCVQEGSIMFPGEPIFRVKGTCFEAQLIESALLNIINFQSLIATKASRVCEAAQGDPIYEFGLRRAQGPDAGIYGARAAYIGGCVGTSNVLAAKLFDIPLSGTMAHSWIQKFDDELEAFRAYAQVYPNNCLLLVDTYDTLKSGIPNAIKVFDELKAQGYTPKGIRIDSGDIAYLSKEASKMLAAAGYPNVSIIASSDLDEDTINSLKIQGATVTGWGVGTNLITAKDCPALGGVYKLVAVRENDTWVPKIKISENPEKITNPGLKKVVRIYDVLGKYALADLIMLDEETINTQEPLTVFHPIYTWKKKTFKHYTVKEMLRPLYSKGKLVYQRQSASQVREYAQKELASLWPEHKRLVRPQLYKVDLSQKLWDLKNDLVNTMREE